MYPSQIVSCWITYIDIQFKNESVENIRCVEILQLFVKAQTKCPLHNYS